MVEKEKGGMEKKGGTEKRVEFPTQEKKVRGVEK